jgi:signal peptidase I
VLVALAAAILVKTFVVAAYGIPSESMEPTLRVGDRVLVEKLGYRIHDPGRGDVIVFDGLDSFTPEVAGGHDFVKRVIGVAGDRVRCCERDGRVAVNGVPLAESGYLYPGDEPSAIAFDIEVPAGMLWVMGDHRSVSVDSRAHLGDPGGGMVPVDRVHGRVVAIVWPVGRWMAVGVPATFALGLITVPLLRRSDLRRTVRW